MKHKMKTNPKNLPETFEKKKFDLKNKFEKLSEKKLFKKLSKFYVLNLFTKS